MLEKWLSLKPEVNYAQRVISWFNELETKIKYAQNDMIHFYTSLKQKITMLETWFHFYASLKPKGKLCLRKPTSFFSELEIENELCSGTVSCFNELETRNKHYSRSHVSFLYKTEIENNYA